MQSDMALQLVNQLLWTAVLISGPLLGLTLLVGLLVSVLQAVTQVQEMSLSFVPKLLAAALVIALCGPWMLRQLLGFATRLISGIPSQL